MAKGVHNALSPILTMSRAFGAFVLVARGQTYVFSRKLLAYYILLTLGAMAEGIIEWCYVSSKYSVSIIMIIDGFVFCFYIVTAMIVLYQHYHLRENLPTILSELEDMDKLIGSVSYSWYYNCRVIVPLILNALPRIFFVLYKPFTWNLLLSRILYFSFTVIPVLIAGQYATILYIISCQLQNISEQLMSVIFNLEVWSLIDVHHNLIILANRINRAFDIFLFHMVSFTFIINTLKLYFMIVYIVKPGSYLDLELTISSVVDFVVNYGSLITIVIAAMEATKKVRKALL